MRGRLPNWCGLSTYRATLALAIIAVSFVATSFIIAQIIRTRSISTAVSIAPYDGRLLGLRAMELAGPGASAKDRELAQNLAMRALRRDGMSVQAYAALGLNASVVGNGALSRNYFKQAENLSRRDFTTQLWAIEDAVSRGDFKDALHHYDISLRTQSTAQELLFPILMDAISQDNVREAMAGVLRKNPPWATSFVQSLAAVGPDLESTRRLFLDLHAARFSFPEGADATLTGRIFASGKMDYAWNYYQAVHPVQARKLLRNGDFQENIAIPAPFDWTLLNSAQSSVSIQKDVKGGALVFDSVSNFDGLLAKQVLRLPPGTLPIDGAGTRYFSEYR